MKTSTLVCAAFMAFGSLFVGSSSALLPPFAYTAAQAFVGKAILFLHSMEKKSTKVDFSPISCKKTPLYTRNGHF